MVRRCLRKRPEERYKDTRDLVAALKRSAPRRVRAVWTGRSWATNGHEREFEPAVS
jgi:hypothetical protein